VTAPAQPEVNVARYGSYTTTWDVIEWYLKPTYSAYQARKGYLRFGLREATATHT
jgi:hypothetical protein